MHGIAYRVWAPPESRVRIEYSTELIRLLSLASAQRDISGVLLGTWDGNTVRITAANADGALDQESAVRCSGLDRVGIFSTRRRGEIFLTETDLKRFEQSSERACSKGASTKLAGPTTAQPADGVALIVAGERGGFFVRDNDGSIQAIRSYREFLLCDGEPIPASVRTGTTVRLRWSWMLWTGLALMAMPLALTSVLGAMFGTVPSAPASSLPAAGWGQVQPKVLSGWPRIFAVHRAETRSEAPLDLTITGGIEALRIAWNRLATGDNARLEIIDGGRHTVISVSRELASVTYEPRSGDVEVQLTDTLAPRSERARFVSRLASHQTTAPIQSTPAQ